jgi:hypothetical protein
MPEAAGFESLQQTGKSALLEFASKPVTRLITELLSLLPALPVIASSIPMFSP